MRIAIVEWVDSSFRHGWFGRDELKEEGADPCISVGIIVEEKDCVKIILNRSPYTWGEAITIPRCSIKRIRYLKIKR